MEEKEKKNWGKTCFKCGEKFCPEKWEELFCSGECESRYIVSMFDLLCNIEDKVEKIEDTVAKTNQTASEPDDLNIDLSDLDKFEEEYKKLQLEIDEPVKSKGVIDQLPEILETVNNCAALFAPKKKKKKRKKKNIKKQEDEQIKSESRIKKFIKSKIEYARLTFILSVIGFIGSIGFYVGVLRQMYSPTSDRQKIEVLQEENSELKNTVQVLIEKIEEDEE